MWFFTSFSGICLCNTIVQSQEGETLESERGQREGPIEMWRESFPLVQTWIGCVDCHRQTHTHTHRREVESVRRKLSSSTTCSIRTCSLCLSLSSGRRTWTYCWTVARPTAATVGKGSDLVNWHRLPHSTLITSYIPGGAQKTDGRRRQWPIIISGLHSTDHFNYTDDDVPSVPNQTHSIKRDDPWEGTSSAAPIGESIETLYKTFINISLLRISFTCVFPLYHGTGVVMFQHTQFKKVNKSTTVI